MRQSLYTILQNFEIAPGVRRMLLFGATDGIVPGQFVEVEVPGHYLRRPISVCDCEENLLTLVYRVVGEGTDRMAAMRIGDTLHLLTGLGNGFDLTKAGNKPMLIGGGVGVPPLYYLAKSLQRKKRRIGIVLGFRTAADVMLLEEFEHLNNCSVRVVTEDGSMGKKGRVTDALYGGSSYFYACGPQPMLQALQRLPIPGEMSLEARMACGFGACMGCTIATTDGPRRVCKDGPVFEAATIQWSER